MRAQNQLLHSRTRVKPRYALFPMEGIPFSRLPTWNDAQVRVLASPALGAQFVEMLIDLPAGKRGDFVPDPTIETFHYVLEGEGEFLDGFGIERALTPGSFGLTPPDRGVSITARTPLKMLVLRKRYEPTFKYQKGSAYYGHESKVKADIYCGDEGAKLQLLIPDDLQYDMAMNIFEFDTGHSLPYVETHVMEHGLYFLQGKGVYYLDDTWMEVEATDFIWMGPYVPQSYYATGPVSSKYIYYKNVNREIAL